MKRGNMKKIFGAGIIALFLITTTINVASLNISSDAVHEVEKSLQNPGRNNYTHTVLVEGCTATWCGYCPPAAAAILTLFESGSYDFYYVSLVADMLALAHDRAIELDFAGYPDYFFDGEFDHWAGPGGLPSAYISRLNSAGTRALKDIDLEMNVTWEGGSQLGVELNITNNDDGRYDGHIHAYVTEIVSRWDDYDGNPYHYAMIGYAFNQDAELLPGETSSYSTTWNGTDHGFGDINITNIMVIASIFDKNNYSYAEQTTASMVYINTPPETFVIEGNCTYANGTDANNITVNIINMNTSSKWEADTLNNHYNLTLVPGVDINATETLRVIVKDNTSYINVTDYTVSSSDISNGIIILDLTLYEYYLDLVDFPMYLAEDIMGYSFNQMCGAAVAQMNLNYMWWNETTYPAGPPLYYADQEYLYNVGHENNSNTSLDFIDATGMNHVINQLDPPYDPYGYNFIVYHNPDFNEIIASICYWIDYPAGNEPGYPEHVPGAVPAYGNYSNWMSIRGIHTNRSVYGSSGPLTVHGFWVNNPNPYGDIGENSYKMASEWNDTYYSPINVPDDPYNGEYVAICEPPEGATSDITLTEVTEYWENQMPDPQGGQFLLQQVVDHMVVYAAKQGVRDRLIPYDSDFEAVFEQTYPGRPVLVKNSIEDKNDYYIVPFNTEPLSWIKRDSHSQPDEDTTLVVVLVDAANGQFKEASWVHEPVVYLPISETDALNIVLDELEDLGYNVGELNTRAIQLDLVYRTGSPYHPEWQVIVDELGLEFFVNQDGAIS